MIQLVMMLMLQSSPPGTITVTQNVVATAGTISCVFTNNASPTIRTVCTEAGVQLLLMDATPAVGATNGYVGSLSKTGNNITWAIQQPTAGNVTWQIVANGSSKSGTF